MNSLISLFSFFILASSIVVTLFFTIRLIDVIRRNINSDLKNNEFQKNFVQLDEIIESNVIATNQSLVNILKESNTFCQLDKEEAFESCKEKIYKMLKENAGRSSYRYLVNLDEWINGRIEYYVRANKKNISN
ncbi:MAG: hypothetical protein N3I35_09965 [Clostridia bacterium]|nr:hypothetical protein [Clostridia bacterium]